MTRHIAVMACAAIVIFLPTMALSQGYGGYGGAYNQQSYGQSMPGYAQPGAFQAYPNYNSYANQMPVPYPGGNAYQNYQQPSMPGGYYQQPTNPGAYYQQQQNPYLSYQQQGSYRGPTDLPPARNFQPTNEATSLVEDGVYWNGQADIDDDDESRYIVPQEQLQPIAPEQRIRRPARRPSVQSTIRAPRRSPARSVRRTAKESRSRSTSTSSKTVVQWGKKAKKAKTKTSLQWGKTTAKPSMVGTEPGTPKENIGQQSAPGGISVQTKEAAPKLQWGKKSQ